ncbi:inositol monophosphatase [Candidatus Uhrbacteria bacterium]|nr:inositol monophosphatase [Candidatus Uhrbacteria bacterium]
MQKEYTHTVAPILREVRPLLLPYYGNAGSVVYKSASPADVVTKLDVRAEEFMKERLRAVDPPIAFVGEEHGGDRTAERLWLLDPIDGTAHFVRGLPFCTTMLALIEEGEVVFSAIYDFVSDVMYSAEKGKGAMMNGKLIHVSTRSLKESYVGWETHLEEGKNLLIDQALRRRCVPIKILCAGYEFAMAACGKLEGRISLEPYGKDYDFAPGAFLVKEAGGVVANIGKRTYDYRNLDFLAVNPVVYKELTEGSDAIFPIKE